MLKVFGFLLLVGVCFAQTKLPITVYYESLCPDSQAFINNQLYPSLRELKAVTSLKLVPFGKSTYTTLGADVQFTCHHGPNECYGNKVHSCAIEHIQVDSFQNEHTRETLTLEYVNCLMKTVNNFKDSVYPGERCAKETGVNNWNVIENCANSTEGSKLLQQNGDLTLNLNPTLTNVPTIVIRNTFDKDVQSLALRDLRSAICNKMQQPIPVECRSHGSGATENTAAVLLTVTSFLLSRLF